MRLLVSFGRRIARRLAGAPRFTIPAVGMLAVGITLSTVCYAVLEAAVLKAIPYPESDRIVEIFKSPPTNHGAHWKLSRSDFDRLKEQATSFEALGYEIDTQALLRTGADEVDEGFVLKASISDGLFSTLRLAPAVGSSFSAADFTPGGRKVALISFELWTTRFSANPGVIGRSILLDGIPFTIIGIMPRELRRPVTLADVWLPDQSGHESRERAQTSDKWVLAKLRKNVLLTSAQKDVERIQAPMARIESRFGIVSFKDEVLGRSKQVLTLLFVACLLINFVACMNVGHLLVARRVSRWRELGIELALGCSKARLHCELMIETVAIALLSCTLALFCSAVLLPIVESFVSTVVGVDVRARINSSVLAFGLGLAVVSGLMCASFPLVLMQRLNVADLIRQRLQSDGLRVSADQIQQLLVVAQITAAVILTCGFLLITKSMYRLSGADLGFKHEGLSYVMFSPSAMTFPMSNVSIENALKALENERTVESIAIGSTPLLTGAHMNLRVSARRSDGLWSELPSIPLQSVSRDYFHTMGIRLLRGRVFNHDDVFGANCAAIVNRSFAVLTWGTEDATGMNIDLNGGIPPRSPCEVVGVVADTKDIALAVPPQPELFLSNPQRPASANAIVVFRSSDATQAYESIVKSIAAVDPSRKPTMRVDIETLVNRAVYPTSTRARLIGILAFLAIALAAGGVYSAASYSVGERAIEFGIRMAVGAAATHIVSLVYKQYARLAFIGAICGYAIAATFSPVFISQLSLFGVEKNEIELLLLGPFLCIALVLLAMTAPIRRALNINPSSLLRDSM